MSRARRGHPATNAGGRHARRAPSALLGVLLAVASSGTAAVEQIAVVALFKDKAMVEIDGHQRLLIKDRRSPEGVLLLSASAESVVLEVDGQAREYGLGRRISTRFAAPAERPSLRIWPTGNGMYLAGGSINGYPVRFLVDTGATLIAMNRNEARRLGIDFRVDGTESSATTASGVVRAYELQLDRVRVGDIELRDVRASVIDGDFPREVLLGNSFLNRLELRRDGQVMELRMRPY